MTDATTVFEIIRDVVTAILLLFSAALSLAAGIGLLRFRSPFYRMHAATKPQILGVMCILLAMALWAKTPSDAMFLVPIAIFQLLTVPVGAHMIGRAIYRGKHAHTEMLYADELEPVVERAEEREERETRAEREARETDEPCGEDFGAEHPGAEHPDDGHEGDASSREQNAGKPGR